MFESLSNIISSTLLSPLTTTIVNGVSAYISGNNEVKDISIKNDTGSVDLKVKGATVEEALNYIYNYFQADAASPPAAPQDQIVPGTGAVGTSERGVPPAGTSAANPPSGHSLLKLDNVQNRGGEIVVSPVFKLVFLTVVALTLILGLAATAMAFVGQAELMNQQAAVFDSMNTGWKLGLGAIFGLLGGKAA